MAKKKKHQASDGRKTEKVEATGEYLKVSSHAFSLYPICKAKHKEHWGSLMHSEEPQPHKGCIAKRKERRDTKCLPVDNDVPLLNISA